ncbi:MAG: Asp-tRNA(Asn) amidotransferase subunit GatC [Euryarchaeota archaeon]|nr:Asp-tRNA(Asn) amidotransferase subunit GatC [Euryarchaeota archaeon]
MKREEIEKRGEELIKEFSEAIADVKEEVETYYVSELVNVVRIDSEPVQKKDFKDKMLKIAPSVDEEGNIRVEIGKWVG